MLFQLDWGEEPLGQCPVVTMLKDALMSLINFFLFNVGGRKYQMVGCFNNDNNLLPELLITERDLSSEKNLKKIVIDWKNWNSYMEAFVYRCLNETTARNLHVFGMSYYGKQYDVTI